MNGLELAKSQPLEMPELGSWEALRFFINGMLPAIAEIHKEYRRRSVHIGFAILKFSERIDVIDEVNKANDGRRGAPIKPINYVAQRLCEQFGTCLPSVKHLQSCARCAEVLRENGALESFLNGTLNVNMREVLGWATPQSLLPMNEEPPETSSEPSTGLPATNSSTITPLAPDEFASRALSYLRQLEIKAQEIAAQKPSHFNMGQMTPQQRDAVRLRVREIDKFLKHFHIRVRCEERPNARKRN